MTNRTGLINPTRVSFPAVLIATLLVFLPGTLAAQPLLWLIDEVWANVQVYELECLSNGPCVAACSYSGEQASMIRLTDDAGRTWRDILTIESSTVPHYIAFATLQITRDRTVYVGCNLGLIAVINDLGASWEFRRAFDTGHVTGLHMIDENRGVAMRNINNLNPRFAIATTNDGWRTSHLLTLPDSVLIDGARRSTADRSVWLEDVAMLGENCVIASYRYPSETTIAIRTTDAGVSWSEIQLGSDYLAGMRFADSLHGWAFGGPARRKWYEDLPALLRTTDGGVSWTKTFDGPRILDLNFRGPENVIAVGNEWEAYLSSDGGVTWRADSCEVRGFVIPHCAIPDASPGLIVTSFGDVLLPKQRSGVAEGITRQETAITSDERSIFIEHVHPIRSVEVHIHDAIGGLVATLAADDVSDTRSIAHFPEALPSGVYAVVVMVDDSVAGSIIAMKR